MLVSRRQPCLVKEYKRQQSRRAAPDAERLLLLLLALDPRLGHLVRARGQWGLVHRVLASWATSLTPSSSQSRLSLGSWRVGGEQGQGMAARYLAHPAGVRVGEADLGGHQSLGCSATLLLLCDGHSLRSRRKFLQTNQSTPCCTR